MAAPVYYIPQQQNVATPGQGPAVPPPVFYGQQPVQQGVVSAAPGPQPPVLAYYSPQQGTVQLYQNQSRELAPNYTYTPSDYAILSVMTVVVCGLFSPFSLAMSIPALLFSMKSKRSNRMGQTKLARRQGMIAAYLNVFAIIFAMTVALLSIGLALGLYYPVYYMEKCKDKVRGDTYTYYRYRYYDTRTCL